MYELIIMGKNLIIALLVIGIVIVAGRSIVNRIRSRKKYEKVIKVSRDLEPEKAPVKEKVHRKEAVKEKPVKVQPVKDNHFTDDLYVYTPENKVWVCACCETENELSTHRCIVCGRYRQED